MLSRLESVPLTSLNADEDLYEHVLALFFLIVRMYTHMAVVSGSSAHLFGQRRIRIHAHEHLLKRRSARVDSTPSPAEDFER